METFDISVIGSGPAGYVAAIKAAQLGYKTALIEKEPHLGGTCLNVGCIPSKALLHSTEHFYFAAKKALNHGIKIEKLSADVPEMMKRKNGVVDQLRQGVAYLVKSRKIKVFSGTASFQKDLSLEIKGNETQNIRSEHTVIATGSVPVELPFIPQDGKTVVSSTEAIAWDKVPKKLIVVGAGAIGLELGSVWSRLGSDVTVVEFLPQIGAGLDRDISQSAQKIFTQQGLKFQLGTKVTGLEKKGRKTLLLAEKNNEKLSFEADKILVSVGRKANTQDLELDKIGINLDEKGRIPVSATYETQCPRVFAIGDVISGPMLAHKAEEEAVAVIELIAGKAGHVDYQTIPNVFYTHPEIATVGISEIEAKEHGTEVKIGKFPLAANGRAIATDATEGMIKVISDAKNDRLLGIQIIAAGASEMIASAVAHMTYGGSAEDIARTVHAHPTLSESIKEAALGVDKNAIHAL